MRNNVNQEQVARQHQADISKDRISQKSFVFSAYCVRKFVYLAYIALLSFVISAATRFILAFRLGFYAA